MPFLKLIIDGEIKPIETAPKDEHICDRPLPGTWDWPMFEAGTIWQCPECKMVVSWEFRQIGFIGKDRFKSCFWVELTEG